MKAGWTEVALGDVVEVFSGFAFDSKNFSTSDGTPLVRIRDVVRGHSETYYAGEYDPRYLVADGDVLIGMDGEFNRARWTGGPALLNQRVCRVTASDPRIDSGYLFHFLPVALQAIEAATPFVTVKHLSAKTLKSAVVPLPPLEEQKRTAAILDKAEELQAKRRAAIAHLDSLTQSIFLDMFGDPAQNAMGWPSASLDQVAGGIGGVKCGPFGTQLSQSEYRDDGVPLWGIKQVNRGFSVPTHEYLSIEKARALGDYDLLAGDIVMTRKGTVGNCAVYPSGYPAGIMHSDLLRIRLSEAEPDFMASQLKFSRAVAHQISLISGGAVMPGINVTKLKSLEVLVPPVSLQTEYSRRLKAVSEHRVKASSADTATGGLAASLASRAFRGDL